ncbi:MAG: DNA sulfur modification protein DndB [Dehalococcoidia bacterium]
MFVHVPAMRGKLGSRTYFACLMPMSAVPNLFKFTDWAGFTPEDREQRVLNEKRVPDLRDYILDNEDDYLFSAITASYKSDPVYEEIKNGGDGSLGVLKLRLGDDLIINDGQHRAAGIAAALKENPALGEQTIAVLLFPYENKDRVQQMFSDLNRFVQKTSKSLDILYDKRDPVSAATLDALEEVPVFRELTDKDSQTLKTKSTKLFTLAALYDANAELLKGRDDEKVGDKVELLVDWWSAVAKQMPDWTAVLTHHKEAKELRAEKISSHSTVLRALGGLGQELMKDPEWRVRLESLGAIDWSKKNPEWEGVCIVANSVVSNRQARAATKSYIKFRLGMPITDAEMRSIGRGPASITAEDL